MFSSEHRAHCDRCGINVVVGEPETLPKNWTIIVVKDRKEGDEEFDVCSACRIELVNQLKSAGRI